MKNNGAAINAERLAQNPNLFSDMSKKAHVHLKAQRAAMRREWRLTLKARLILALYLWDARV